MNRVDDLRDLHHAVEARYRICQAEFLKIVEAENALRAELRRLDAQVHQAEVRGDPQMRAIGADILWKAWVGRAKHRLNLKLAQVLAKKETRVRDVKRAYGKVVVAEELLAASLTERRKARETAALDRAIEQAQLGRPADQ
jgi:hypothetical protein